MNKLEQLRQMTVVVADTGDIDSIATYKPRDATTNPSLILAAAQKTEYVHLIDEARSYSKQHNVPLLDKLFVNFGIEILKQVPGRVSTEVDARLSFDVKASIEKARLLVSLYEKAGIPRERLLIKLASTWEGILAGRTLEKEGIHVNMTLLFSLPQAIACAQAKATLVSPFVGRILDWYKKAEGVASYPPADDPGVRSVQEIYHYFKKFNHKTEIMGASFRNVDQILELAGCDLLTIAPSLLEELRNSTGDVPRKLIPNKKLPIIKQRLDEKAFRFQLNENAMATEKLSEGIRFFSRDIIKLEKQVLFN